MKKFIYGMEDFSGLMDVYKENAPQMAAHLANQNQRFQDLMRALEAADQYIKLHPCEENIFHETFKIYCRYKNAMKKAGLWES